MAWISRNDYLNETEQQNNATEFYNFFSELGWTVNALAGMLGNIEVESTINPGLWQSRNEGNLDGGFGLVQWTPARNYIEWAGANYAEGNRQCERIIYELENGLQYYPTADYPLTFREFSKSTNPDIAYLVRTFEYNYERAGDPDIPLRESNGLKWFQFLSGLPPYAVVKKSKWIYYLKRRMF